MRVTLRITALAACAGDDPAPTAAWVPTAARRRMDALARTASVAVDRALAGAKPHPDTALVLSTSYGAVDSTYRFVGSIAQFRDEAASPTPFTMSVHNSAAGTIGELLGLHGPATTLSMGGLGTLAALRWAALVLAAGRAPAVLAVIGDRHNDWGRRVVTALTRARWPIADGVVACLIEPGDGPGRELRLGEHAAARALDGGAVRGDDERALADSARARGQRRLVAPDLLGRWWPCCVLAAAEPLWRDAEPIALRECEEGLREAAWLGAYAG